MDDDGHTGARDQSKESRWVCENQVNEENKESEESEEREENTKKAKRVK